MIITEKYTATLDRQFAAQTMEEARTKYHTRHSEMLSEKKVGPIKTYGDEESLHIHPGTTTTIKFHYGNMHRKITIELTGTPENIRDSKPILEKLVGERLIQT